VKEVAKLADETDARGRGCGDHVLECPNDQGLGNLKVPVSAALFGPGSHSEMVVGKDVEVQQMRQGSGRSRERCQAG